MIGRLRRDGITLFTGLAVLAALSVVSAVLQAAQAVGHLIALGLLAAMAAGAFHLGRAYERTRTPRPASKRGPAVTTALSPAVSVVEDQVAELEHLAGRDLPAIIASYRIRQQKYGGVR